MKSSVDLVVLKYDYSAVKPLMEANSAFKAVMWLCFVMVALNASFWRLLSCTEECSITFGKNVPKRKEVFRSGRLQSAKQEHSQIHREKGESANCIVVAKEVNEDLKSLLLSKRFRMQRSNRQTISQRICANCSRISTTVA